MPNPRNRWRSAFVVLLAIWVITVGVLGYEIVDQAVTITYGRVSYDEMEHSIAVMKRLTPAIQGRNQRLAFLELLRDQNPKGFIVTTDSTVEMDGLVFEFAGNGQLTKVK